MEIRSVHLENIRSYVDAKVEFTTGKVLLQGDIGSGKSTILLAIEFALFGVLRGVLMGGALLRHGEKQGAVTLECIIEGKRVFIKRSLRAGKQGVDQDEGILIVDDVFMNLTPTELKVRILDLLGYPSDLLTKSKALIYRYTVYTPQEEMKRILMESSDVRIGVFRRMFDVDKYKRVLENVSPYLRELREREKLFEGLSRDLEEKKVLRQKKEAEQGALHTSLAQAKELRDESKETARLRQESVQRIEESRKQQEAIRGTIQSLHAQDRTSLAILLDVRAERTRLEDWLSKQPKESQSEVVMPSNRDALEKELATVQAAHDDVVRRLTVCATHITHAEQIKGKLIDLSECPVCLQSVDKSHKESVLQNEDEKMLRMNEKMAQYRSEKEEWTKKIITIKSAISEALKKEQQAAVAAATRKVLVERAQRKDELMAQEKRRQDESDLLKKQIAELSAKVSPEIESTYARSREEYESARLALHKAEVMVATEAERVLFVEEVTRGLAKEIAEKETAKKSRERIQKYASWLDKQFTPIVGLIEKHVLARIHQSFNELFVEWFKILVESESFGARLDDEFTPIIEQSGYETTVDNLSGGERTACALAYRLALTKVINTLLGNIRTRDLLILDEPTEGFSTEQLDRMRDVLDRLGLKQIIIVSHEQKMESFVDHVIRVEKEDDVSRVTVES